MTFYDSTPSGRVLNRYSSDVACVDDSLPFLLNILLANSVGLLGLLAVLGSGLPWLLLLLPPLGFIYYSVQHHYRASFLELRRLGSLTLSPLYSHLADTLAGLPVLRAAGATYRYISQPESGMGMGEVMESRQTGGTSKGAQASSEDREDTQGMYTSEESKVGQSGGCVGQLLGRTHVTGEE